MNCLEKLDSSGMPYYKYGIDTNQGYTPIYFYGPQPNKRFIEK